MAAFSVTMDLRILALVGALCCVAYSFEFNVEDMPQEFRGKRNDTCVHQRPNERLSQRSSARTIFARYGEGDYETECGTGRDRTAWLALPMFIHLSICHLLSTC